MNSRSAISEKDPTGEDENPSSSPLSLLERSADVEAMFS